MLLDCNVERWFRSYGNVYSGVGNLNSVHIVMVLVLRDCATGARSLATKERWKVGFCVNAVLVMRCPSLASINRRNVSTCCTNDSVFCFLFSS